MFFCSEFCFLDFWGMEGTAVLAEGEGVARGLRGRGR